MGSPVRYSKVSRRMWNDLTFRSLSAPPPNAQSLWVRLLTGPELTNIPGVIMAWEAGLAQALKWPLEAFREAFREVEAAGLVRADWSVGLVWVRKAFDHNKPESPNVVRSWSATWDIVPECDLKNEIHQSLASSTEGLSKAYGQAFRESCPKASSKPMANQEPEQEQEQDQDPPKPPLVSETVLIEPESVVVPIAPVVEEAKEPPKPDLAKSPVTQAFALQERTFWIQAYASAVSEAAEIDPWIFPPKQFPDLVEVVVGHCLGSDLRDIPGWISRDVCEFVDAVISTGQGAQYWGAYAPSGLLKWHNLGRPGLATEQPDPNAALVAVLESQKAKREAEEAERRRDPPCPPSQTLITQFETLTGKTVPISGPRKAS